MLSPTTSDLSNRLFSPLLAWHLCCAGLDTEVVALGKELIDKRPSAGHAWGVGSDADNDASLARTTLLALQVWHLEVLVAAGT